MIFECVERSGRLPSSAAVVVVADDFCSAFREDATAAFFIQNAGIGFATSSLPDNRFTQLYAIFWLAVLQAANCPTGVLKLLR